MVYMITYDLNSPGQNYNHLIQAIKSCSVGGQKYCSFWKSSYLIKSAYTAQQISARLTPWLDKNDRLMVVAVQKQYDGFLTSEQWMHVHSLFQQ